MGAGPRGGRAAPLFPRPGFPDSSASAPTSQSYAPPMSAPLCPCVFQLWSLLSAASGRGRLPGLPMDKVSTQPPGRSEPRGRDAARAKRQPRPLGWSRANRNIPTPQPFLGGGQTPQTLAPAQCPSSPKTHLGGLGPPEMGRERGRWAGAHGPLADAVPSASRCSAPARRGRPVPPA